MEIVVLARRFRNGNWEPWKHICNKEEVEGIVDFAQPKTAGLFLPGRLNAINYLEGARYIFDAMYGEADGPRDGDTRVHGVRVDGHLIGMQEELLDHFIADFNTLSNANGILTMF